jgi:diacylglycerol kinase family enzyme
VSTTAPFVAVIVNRTAGAARQDANSPQHIEELFRKAGVPVRIFTPASGGHADEAARAAIAAGARAVVAGGGDGTARTVASTVAGSPIPFGILPLGTLNHFAKDLRIPIDLEKAVQIIAAGRVQQVDVGEVNDRMFLNNSSIGIYPNIVVERERLRAESGYRKWTAFAVAAARILRRYRGVVVRVDRGGSRPTVRTPFLFVGNNEYDIDGLRMGGRARMDGGRLFACLAPRLHARNLPALFARALAGRAGPNALESFSTGELHVTTPTARRLRVSMDGEVAVMSTPLVFRTQPRALTVFAPGE